MNKPIGKVVMLLMLCGIISIVTMEHSDNFCSDIISTVEDLIFFCAST